MAHQLPFASMLPQISWQATPVSDLPSWDNVKRVGLDCETKDPNLKKLGIGVYRGDGKLIGVSFAFEDGPGFYLPFGHEGEGNLDKETVMRYLREQASTFTGVIGGSNLDYDLPWLIEEGVDFTKATFRDIGVAEPLLNEHRFRYGLDPLALVYGIPGKDERVLRKAAALFQVDPKSELWRLPPKFVGEYAERDAHLPLKILRKQERLIEQQELWPIYNLESDVLPVLVRMRRRGIPVDIQRLDKVTAHLDVMMQKMVDDINHRSTVRISVGDLKTTANLAPLVRSLGYELPKTKPTKNYPQGQDSLTKDIIASLNHPIGVALNKARGFHTMKTNFCNQTYKLLVNGRVHPTYNQLKKDKNQEDKKGKGKATDVKGSVGGRLSADNPSVQNQPIRHPTLGAVWRGIYKPEPGEIWVSSDYSSQEPRLTIHYSELCNLEGAKEEGDRFRNDPDADAYERMVKLTGMPRKTVKAILLGLSYSMGGAKFCDTVGLPTARKKIDGEWRLVAGSEGQKMLNDFNAAVPYIKKLSRKCIDKAKNTGVINTLLGRACHFETDDLKNYLKTHKAMNRLIQGGSADQMKKAMVLADKAGIALRLQVHDELDFSAKNVQEAEHLAEVMRDAVKLLVPSKVDLEMGPSWGEINQSGRDQCAEFYG